MLTSDQIKSIREKLGLTRMAFGALVGATRNTMNRIEKPQPSAGNSFRLSSGLEIRIRKAAEDNGIRVPGKAPICDHCGR